MALSPKDLLKQDPLDQAMLDALETEIDGQLREFGEICPGGQVSIGITSGANAATVKALKRLYEAAGWRDVRINMVHHIVTMKCPRFRQRRGGEPEPVPPYDAEGHASCYP